MRRSFFLFIFITYCMNTDAMQEVDFASESENTHEIHSESSDPENPPQYVEIEIISADPPPATDSSHAHSAPRDRRSRVIKLLAFILTSSNFILNTTLALSEDGESMGPLAYTVFLTSVGACGTTVMYMALDNC